MAAEAVLYENKLPAKLADETERFDAAGLRRVIAPSDEFDQLAADGDLLIYVVTRTRVLVVCQDELDAHHSVLALGDVVLAAGELSLSAQGEHKIVLDVNERSGHYLPDPTCRLIVAEVLRGLGFFVPDDLLDS